MVCRLIWECHWFCTYFVINHLVETFHLKPQMSMLDGQISLKSSLPPHLSDVWLRGGAVSNRSCNFPTIWHSHPRHMWLASCAEERKESGFDPSLAPFFFFILDTPFFFFLSENVHRYPHISRIASPPSLWQPVGVTIGEYVSHLTIHSSVRSTDGVKK